MPTYEYLCKNCGDRFEKFQKFSAKPLKTHDVCGGEVQKVFHASGVVFKGPGFYATDNRGSGRSSIETSSDTPSTDTTPSANGSASKKSASKDSAPAAAAAD